ncbi:MAG: DUF72 domain-containing protein [Myxococcales bacterium]|nr:DUF72 domain-containing protein [Myxococcales bacterium]
MATRLHVGAKHLKGDLEAYAKRFDLLEVAVPEAADLRFAPTPATLRRWRKAAPPTFEFCVIAGPNVARLRPGDALEAELEVTLAQLTTLESRAVLLRTPIDVTPGPVWRDRMQRMLDRLPRDVTSVIWEPRGVWQAEEAAEQAKRWGVVLAVDPLREEVPDGPVAYVRLRELGATRSYGLSQLDRVAQAIGQDRRDAYVVIETSGALKECKTLRRLVRESKGGARAGAARLIRPRGIKVLRIPEGEQDE